jgi:hypothetical protein
MDRIQAPNARQTAAAPSASAAGPWSVASSHVVVRSIRLVVGSIIWLGLLQEARAGKFRDIG